MIRFAKTNDFSKIRKFDPHSQYLDPKKIKRKVQDKEIILVWDGKKIVGILKFSYFWQTRPYIDLIFIDEKYRGKGISVLLLKFLERFLVKEKYAYLFSSSEQKGKKAQNWHKYMGFKEMGKLTKINLPHDKTAEIFFSKKISNFKKLRKYPV